MRIVVLDGYTLNPGDLSWSQLEALGTCEIYDRTPSEMIVPRARGADVLLTNKTPLERATIAQLDGLRCIGVLATGYDVIDLEAAGEHNVLVTNVSGYGSRSVAQMVFAHLLNLTQHVGHHAAEVRSGDWSRQPDFCYWDRPLVELAGMTMGIVGCGRIGRTVAGIARAFDMYVLVADNTLTGGAPEGAELVELDHLFRTSDVISLHCPLTPSTRELVNAARLTLMKPTAFLINTARGALVDEEALAAALNDGRLAGAGLDVLAEEPPPINHPLLTTRNCYVTPHIAWATRAARQRLMDTVVENVRAFLEGRPQNVVNVG